MKRFLLVIPVLAVLTWGLTAAAKQDDQITICHATGNGGYVTNTVDSDGNMSGHANHDGDLIPAPEGGCPTNTGATGPGTTTSTTSTTLPPSTTKATTTTSTTSTTVPVITLPTVITTTTVAPGPTFPAFAPCPWPIEGVLNFVDPKCQPPAVQSQVAVPVPASPRFAG